VKFCHNLWQKLRRPAIRISALFPRAVAQIEAELGEAGAKAATLKKPATTAKKPKRGRKKK
jgi:hypothetical protein